ncbi:MAG: hypothetical protein IJ011_05510 [Clostridia bacterium]|nr:hypothetical protein [Clostridia bacterium]
MEEEILTDVSVSESENEAIEEAAEEALAEEVGASPDDSDALRAEIERLRGIIAQREAESAKSLGELEEFYRLFPDTSVKDVPDAVWQRVSGGIPLSAAYALYERELSLLSRRADEVNTRNASLSAGKAGDSPRSEYFSPDEVRVMSQKEVHENYAKIRRSMEHWRRGAGR